MGPKNENELETFVRRYTEQSLLMNDSSFGILHPRKA